MKRYEGQAFEIIGVNYNDTEDVFRQGVRQHGVTWTNAFHGAGANPIAVMWGVRSFPTMHIIDADGNIAAMSVRGDQIEQTVDRLLASKQQGDQGK